MGGSSKLSRKLGVIWKRKLKLAVIDFKNANDSPLVAGGKTPPNLPWRNGVDLPLPPSR